jgi:hypothetical protein
MKAEYEEQREQLEEDLYSSARIEARNELLEQGFYLPQAQPIPHGGRVIGYNLVSRAPPPNYHSAQDKDRVGLRHRPGSVHPHVSAMHDGQPGSYTYVGDLYFPDYSGGMSQYFGPQVSPNVDRGGANAFRVLAGLPAERKHHFHHFNPHMQPPMQMPY